MKNRRKHAQREEVRQILHAMRLELAAQRLVYEREPDKRKVVHLNEIITQASVQVRGSAGRV